MGVRANAQKLSRRRKEPKRRSSHPLPDAARTHICKYKLEPKRRDFFFSAGVPGAQNNRES